MAFDYKEEFHLYKQSYLKDVKVFYSLPSTKAALTSILFLATLCFFSLLVIKPTVNTVAGLWKEIEVKKAFSQKLTSKIQALEKAKALVEKNQSVLLLVDKALPKEADFGRFEREIQYLAYKHHVILAEAQFGQFNLVGTPPEAKTSTAGSKKNLPLVFRVKMAGSYLNLKNFLNELDNLDRIVIFKDAKFGHEVDVYGAPLQLDLSTEVYYYP